MQLTEASATVVRYDAELSAAEARHHTQAHVQVDSGEVRWAAEPPESLQWLQKYATAALRAAHRGGDGQWPRRLTRWRSAPERA